MRPAGRAVARLVTRLDSATRAHRHMIRTLRWVDLGLFTIIFVFVVGAGLIGLGNLLLKPLPPAASGIPGATLRSFSRLALAYGIALGWTIPAAAFLGRNRRASRVLTPVIEVSASLPATALLPVILGLAIAVTQDIGQQAELAALLIALFSMQWYLLFNLIAGVRAIPADLDEAARSFGLRGLTYWRRLLLPAMAPSLLTGSITAWGAGWNALIVSEYIRYNNVLYSTNGIGYLMDVATFDVPDGELLLLSILTMVLVVLAMNKLLWRPLFKRAAIKYRLEV